MKKKILSLILVFIVTLSLLFVLTACGDDEDDDYERKSSKKKVSSEEEIDNDFRETYDGLSKMEVEQFNQEFMAYEGNQILGDAVVELLDKLVTNTSRNSNDGEKIVNIIYVETRTRGGVNESSLEGSRVINTFERNILDENDIQADYALAIDFDSSNTDIKCVNSLRAKIALKHYYTVSFHKNENSGLIDYAIIKY